MIRTRILARRARLVAMALTACGAGTQTAVVVGKAVPVPSTSAAPDPELVPPKPEICLSVSMRPRIMQRIQFASNSATLDPEMTRTLDDIVAFLGQNPEYRIIVRGHIDNIELPALAEARATVVRAYMEKNGIDAKRLDQTTFGSGLPIDSNSTEEGRARNRRVDFELLE